MRLIYTFLLLITFSINAQTNWYVSKANGNNNNTGTSANSPFKTIEYANTHGVSPGDTVFIMDEYHNNSYDPNFSFDTDEENASDNNDERLKGIKNEHLWHGENTIKINKVHGLPGTNGNPDQYITYKPYDANTILKGDGANILRIQNSSYIKVEGFNIEGEVSRIPLETALACQFIYIHKNSDIANLSLAPNNVNQVENHSGNNGVVPNDDKVYYRVPPHWTLAQIKANNTSANSNGQYNGPGWIVINNILRPSYTSTRGLYVSSSHHIIIKNNNIHHMPGGGLRLSDIAYSEVIENKIHNNSRRSYGGTHGLVVTKATSDAEDVDIAGNGDDFSINPNDDTTNRIKILRNSVYFNFNEVYSWNAQKTLLTPHIDEGKGISLQRNRSTDAAWSSGRILVANNICYWNGYSGVHTNDGERIDFVNNTCYFNSYTQSITYNGSGNGGNIGISASDGVSITMDNNISVVDGDIARFAMSSNQSNNLTSIANNILWSTKNALIEDTDISQSTALSNQTIADPLFVAVYNKAQVNNELTSGNDPSLLPFDFHEQLSSDAIDGANSNNSVMDDYFKTQRDVTPDVGAIENDKCNSANVTEWKMINGTPAWTNGTPDDTKPVIISENYTVTADINCCSLEIKPNTTITVEANKTLKIENDLTNNGTLNILNTGSLVLVASDGLIKGNDNYTIHKTTPTYGYYDYTYWSSPTESEQINGALSGSPENYIYKFIAANFLDIYNTGSPNQTSGTPDGFDDDHDAWQHVSQTEIMTPGVGYIAMGEGSPLPFSTTQGTATQSVTFTGKPNTGLIEVPVYKDLYHQNNLSVTGANVTNTNINLLGNPYPSAIDLKAFYTINNATSSIIQGTFYYWTHDTTISNTNLGPNAYNYTSNDYATATYDGTDFINTDGATNGTTAPEFLASGQSLFVNVVDNGTVKFTNAMRVVGHNDSFLRPQNSSLDLLKLSLTNTIGSYREIAIAFKPTGSDGFTDGQDGVRLKNENEIDFYSIINNDLRRFAIQTLSTFDDTKTVPLGIEITNANTGYQISLETVQGVFQNGQNVYLKDNVQNVIHNLTQSPYNFTSSITEEANDRFTILFRNSTLGINQTSQLSNILIVDNKEELLLTSQNNKIIKQVTVFNMLGQQLVNMQSNNTQVTIPIHNNKGSVLVLKIHFLQGDTQVIKLVKK